MIEHGWSLTGIIPDLMKRWQNNGRLQKRRWQISVQNAAMFHMTRYMTQRPLNLGRCYLIGWLQTKFTYNQP